MSRAVARTETFMFDASGGPVDPDDPTADHGEQTEYDADGEVIRRLYLRAGTFDPVDAAITTEGPWNLTVEGRRVETLDDLLAWTGAHDPSDPRNLDRVAACTLLAAWVNAPADLQREVYAYLAV